MSKRKTISRVLIAVLLVLFSVLPVCAASESFSVDVYARYIPAAASAPVESGSANIAGDAGVGVSGAADALKSLIVFPITPDDPEAWAWLTDCLAGIGTPVLAYDIYFLDEDENRINADGVSISILCPEAEGLVACSVAVDGTAAVLDSTVRDGAVVFTANGSHYYVLVQPADAEVLPEWNIQSMPGQISAYLRSDSGSMLLLWIGVLVTLLAVLLLFDRRERRNK